MATRQYTFSDMVSFVAMNLRQATPEGRERMISKLADYSPDTKQAREQIHELTVFAEELARRETPAERTITRTDAFLKIASTYERVTRYTLIGIFPTRNAGLAELVTLASRADANGVTEYVVHRCSARDNYTSLVGGYYTTSLEDARADIIRRDGLGG